MRIVLAATVLVGAGVVAIMSGVARAGDGAHDGRVTPLYYVDPMHPSYTSPQPGTAPDCGMQLVPVYSRDGETAEDEPAGKVHATAEQQRLIGATFATAILETEQRELRLPARVTADESRVYTINTGINGFIRELADVTTGTHVVAGQWLATFSAPDARAAIQGYLISVDTAERARRTEDGESQLELATASIRQAEDRLLNLGMSPRQVSEVRRTRIVPADIEVAAPRDGVILSRTVSLGERLDRGAALFRMADLRRVWVVAELFGVAAEYVRVGAAADIVMPNRAGALTGTVTTILPEFDPATQSLKVRLEADNPADALRPGMLVDVMLPIALPPAVTVPADAILDDGSGTRVIVEAPRGVFMPRNVVTGWRFEGRVAIVEGLEPGERVVLGGAFLLDAESRLQGTRER